MPNYLLYLLYIAPVSIFHRRYCAATKVVILMLLATERSASTTRKPPCYIL